MSTKKICSINQSLNLQEEIVAIPLGKGKTKPASKYAWKYDTDSRGRLFKWNKLRDGT